MAYTLPSATNAGHDSEAARRASLNGTSRAELKHDAFKKIRLGLVSSFLYFGVLAFYAFCLSDRGYGIYTSPAGLVLGLLPVAWALAGVLQLITGTPFEELSRRWDSLSGSARGGIGISVFVIGLVVVMVLLFLGVMILQFIQTGHWQGL